MAGKIFNLILFICILFGAYSKVFASPSTHTNTELFLYGPDETWSGNTETYYLTYKDVSDPLALQFISSVSNGEIVSEQLDPRNDILFVTVRWFCDQQNGVLEITESNLNISITRDVRLLSYYTDPALFCLFSLPSEQFIPANALPRLIQILNCSPTCHEFYDFSYEWEEAEVIPGQSLNFAIIPNEVGLEYQPPIYNSNKVMAFRRITHFTSLTHGSQVIYSGNAIVNYTVNVVDPANLPITEVFIDGPDDSYEGSIETYLITYNTTLDKNSLEFKPTITNGTIVNYDLNPLSNRIFIKVRWDCGIVNGSVSIVERNSNAEASKDVIIHGYYSHPNLFCVFSSPTQQDIWVNVIPAKISISNSAPSCWWFYRFSYQWQSTDVINGVPQTQNYQDIPHETSADFYPPSFSYENHTAYRRYTSYAILTPTGYQFQDVYSNNTIVNIYEHLDPGFIHGNGSGFFYTNYTLNITQVHAFGGNCNNTGYFYTWEMSTNNGPWQAVAYSEEFPPNIVITASTIIRRKVVCGNETEYSNSITYTLTTLLHPGSISGGGAVVFNGTPNVSQLPATGGLCLPANYVYTWQRSIENGTWENIGTGINYPASAPPIVADTRIRRSVKCGSEILFTNIVYITLIYTSPNAENLNYVRINIITKPGVVTWPEADALPIGDKYQSTTYLDGFGRPIQKVLRQQSIKQLNYTSDPNYANDLNNYQDLVSNIEYDGLGRNDKDFIPYATTTNLGLFKTNAHDEQKYLTNLKYGEPAGSEFTYSKVLYDGSPLNRVINTKLPGYNWNNDPSYKGISNKIEVYKSVEKVHIWNIDFTAGAIPSSSLTEIYPDDKLIKDITIDEKDRLIYEYKDLSGNVILKKVQEKEGSDIDMNGHRGWLCTYYVYDDFGRLRYTITPKAVRVMDPDDPSNTGNIWTVTPEIKKGLCFYQEYDKKGRVTVKHSPDGGEVWLVYDNRNRLVLSQDENQRNRVTANVSKPNQWSFSLYDDNDRVLSTGLLNDEPGAGRDRIAMQSMVDQISLNAQNRQVQIFTPNSETITAYNPVAGKISGSGGYYCQSCTNCFTNSVSYYDGYNSFSKTYVQFNTSDFAPSNNQYVEQATKSLRVKGMATTTKVRILDDKYDNGNISDEKFLSSTTYIDERGRVIQNHSENIKGGTDISSLQYDFAGKVLCTRGKHAALGSLFNDLLIITKNDYDLLGRPIRLWKLYTKNVGFVSSISNYKKLSEVWFDEFGSIKTKVIGNDPDPANVGKPMETQDYSYNIQGWLNGINKDYALADGNNSNPMFSQWSRRFGMYFGYEYDDDKFLNSPKQWNGSIRGTIWRSQGDNSPRKFSYEYDNINRFTAAKYLQKENPSDNNWVNTKVDFTTMVSGYDANGNILGMQQTGIIPGSAGGILLDNLSYNYFSNSNKLKEVSDAAFGGVQSLNGKQGDFKDYTPSNSIDYDYDFNGNLVYDKNKNIIDEGSSLTNPVSGIINNYLDLPHQITIKGKSKIEYTYDAAGAKLAKKVIQLVTNPPPAITTYYLGGFVYEENELQYILNEEGKLRIIEPVAAWSGPSLVVNYLETQGNLELINSGSIHKWGVWDYFIKDNLSNTRMVLTEEKHLQQMVCKMEDPAPTPSVQGLEEEATFGQSTSGFNEVQQTRFDRSSTGWTSNTSDKVSKLLNVFNGSTYTSIGPNAILKVMSGDKVAGTVNYFYQANGASVNPSIINNIASSLFAALSGSITAVSSVKQNISPAYLSASTGPINNFLDNTQQGGNTNTPRAYINIIFFDEQFNYVNEASYAKPVDPITSGTSIEGALPFSRTATKNGYAYIYISNESTNIPVYFDELNVSHVRGPIVEDNAYYPYGLKIQGISAKAALKIQTKQGFQGDYNELDEETGYNEFNLRVYDAQIGRFVQADPFEEFPSPYTGMGNDPVNNVDEDGGWSVGLTGMAIGIGVGFAASYAIEAITGKHIENKGLWGLGGAFLGAGIGYGAGASLAGEGSFLNNTVAFYDGLLGTHFGELNGSGQVSLGSRLGCFNNMADIPNLWGWLPSISLPSINLNLYKWVDDVALSAWRVIDVLKLVTEGAAPQNPDYKPMDRSVKVNPSGDRYIPDDVRVHDEKTITVPTGDKTKTKLVVEGPITYEGIFSREVTTEQTGAKYKVTIDHRARSGAGYRYNSDGSVASGGKNYKPTESKVQVVTSRREKIGIRRLKILGLKTPFTKKP